MCAYPIPISLVYSKRMPLNVWFAIKNIWNRAWRHTWCYIQRNGNLSVAYAIKVSHQNGIWNSTNGSMLAARRSHSNVIYVQKHLYENRNMFRIWTHTKQLSRTRVIIAAVNLLENTIGYDMHVNMKRQNGIDATTAVRSFIVPITSPNTNGHIQVKGECVWIIKKKTNSLLGVRYWHLVFFLLTLNRPFECIICGKTSTTKTNHNKHVKIHHARDPLTAEG